MEEIKPNKQQEKLFYKKLAKFEKDYIKSLYHTNDDKNKNQSSFLAEKLNEIQELILELIGFQADEESSATDAELIGKHSSENFREIKLKNLIKRIKSLSKEEGGFLYMPFRIVFYNFYLHNVNNHRVQEHKLFPQEDNMIELGMGLIYYTYWYLKISIQ